MVNPAKACVFMQTSPFRFTLQFEQVNRILAMLTRVLGVRLVIFDPDHGKWDTFDVKKQSGYCSTLRRNAAFNALCVDCDLRHLQQARDSKKPVVYVCHEGLVEGVVPFFNDAGEYLGAIQFGQIRLPGRHARDRKHTGLFKALPCYGLDHVRNIAFLLECLADYIYKNQLVYLRRAQWAERIREHVKANLSAPLTIDELARAGGVSPSFLSHEFKREFGLSARQYVIKQKVEAARKLLKKDVPVKSVAEQLGFCDEFHFSKMFKAFSGKAPSVYRLISSKRSAS